jgi:hypothetical protein
VNHQADRERPGPLVHRGITFTVESFDRLKAFQRELEQQQRRTFTNSETLCELIRRATAGQ